MVKSPSESLAVRKMHGLRINQLVESGYLWGNWWRLTSGRVWYVGTQLPGRVLAVLCSQAQVFCGNRGSKQRRRRRQRERQKSNRFQQFGKTTTLHVHHAFLYISLQSLYNYDVKMPNFTFCGGREHTTTTFVFFSWTLIKFFRIQIQKKIANIWRIERVGISAITFLKQRDFTFKETFS